jgi:hypothetical protein
MPLSGPFRLWHCAAMNRLIAPGLALLLAACSSEKPAAAPSEGAEPALGSESVPATEAPDASAATAAANAIQSRYTSLKDCKVIEDGGGEDWSVSRCAGLGGYSLMVNYGDARDDLELHLAGKQPVLLGLTYLAGGGFNALGDTIEWRGTGAGAKFAPTAMILRNSAVQDPEHPERPTALLAVVDLKQACVVAQVNPQARQNEAARTIADGPRQRCLPLERP